MTKIWLISSSCQPDTCKTQVRSKKYGFFVCKILEAIMKKIIFAKDRLHLGITIKQACCSAFDLHYLSTQTKL